MSLVKQSNKARKLNSVICLTTARKHITTCRSDTDTSVNYQQTIARVGREIIDGHKITIYSIKCEKVTGAGMELCQGNGHTHTLCKHSLAGVRAIVKAQGKMLKTAKTLENALHSAGRIVKLVGESGFVYGAIK